MIATVFENPNAIFFISMLGLYSSLLWPVLVSSTSRLHHLGMFIHSFGLALLLGLVIFSYQEMSSVTFDVVVVNNFILSMKISKIGLIFALLITILWPAAYFYSIGYLKSSHEGSNTRFLIFLNMAVCFGITLSFSGNLLTMFIFYELLTLSTLPLVGHHFSTHVNKALKKYIIYLFGGSMVLWLPAILYINLYAGSTEFTDGGIKALAGLNHEYIIILFCLSLFGVTKAAIFPVHGWLPAAMAANYPTSSLLHAVLVVNTGVFCLYKIIYEIFGIELLAVLFSKNYLVYYILIFGIGYSGIIGIFQETVKKVLAWSTVAQLNLILLIALAGEEQFLSFSFFALIYHSFSKITLFFSSGYIYISNHATRLFEFREVVKKFPLIFALFILACIALSGLPIFFYGHYKKMLLVEAFVKNNYFLLAGIIISSVLSVIYLGRIVIEMCLKFEESQEEREYRRTNLYMLFATIYTATLTLLVTIYSKELYAYLQILLRN